MEEHLQVNAMLRKDGTKKTYLELQAENAAAVKAAEVQEAGLNDKKERARVLRQQAQILKNQARLEEMHKVVMAGLRDPNFKGPLAEENILLRKEVAALKHEAESLRRALGIRERTLITPDQLAASSSEL